MLTNLIIHISLTFVFATLAIFVFVKRYVFGGNDNNMFVLASVAGLVPLGIAFLLEAMFLLFPGRNSNFYVYSIYAFIIFLVVISWRMINFDEFYQFLKSRLSLAFILQDKLYSLALLIVILMLSTVSFISVFSPVVGNDQFEYSVLARTIYQGKDISIYPVLGEEANGLLAPWTHPLSTVMLFVWGYLGQGTAEVSFALRLYSAYYLICTVVLMLGMPFSNEKRIISPIACMLLLTTPLLVSNVVTHHIDLIRIFALLNVVMLFAFYREKLSFSMYLALSTSLALYTHSISMIACVYAVALVCIMPSGYKDKFMKIFLLAILCFLVMGYRYAVNLEVFGTILGDTTPVWQLDFIKHTEHVMVERGLFTAEEKWYNGVFKGLTLLHQFGYPYLILVCSAAFIILARLASLKSFVLNFNMRTIPIPAMLSFFVFITFYGVVALSVLLGSISLVKTSRYLLTIHPFVCVLGAYALFVASMQVNAIAVRVYKYA